MKIAYQGIEGSYSESCAKEMYPDSKTIPCKTFDDVFKMADTDEEVMAIIPESNRTTGNIGVEYLIFKYRLNIYEEKFYPINHCLLGVPGSKVQDIKNIYHHIGVYCYKVSILEKFVNLKPTKNELNNRLEQLRAIDNNIKIHVALASSSPIGVDTEEDYLALKKIMEYKS